MVCSVLPSFVCDSAASARDYLAQSFQAVLAVTPKKAEPARPFAAPRPLSNAEKLDLLRKNRLIYSIRSAKYTRSIYQ